MITRWEHGSAYPEDDGYNRRRYDRWGYDSFDDEDDDEAESDSSDDDFESRYTMEEVFDEGLTATHWRNRNNKKVKLGEIDINANNIVSSLPFNEWKVSKEDFEGYTGNAGMTLERWYHRAAIVMWPQAAHFSSLCNAGTDSAIGGLHLMVKKLKRIGQTKTGKTKKGQTKKLNDYTAFANAIIQTWHRSVDHYWSPTSDAAESVDRELFCQSLAELKNVDLINRYVSLVLPKDAQAPFTTELAQACRELGWQSLTKSFTEIYQLTDFDMVVRNANLLETLSKIKDKNPEHNQLLRSLATEFQKVWLEQVADQTKPRRSNSAHATDHSELLVAIVKSMLAIGDQKLLALFLEQTFAHPNIFDLTATHLAAIFKLEKRLPKLAADSAATACWLKECEKQLAAAAATEPKPPRDETRQAKVPCNCADCEALSVFLADPQLSSTRMPMAKERRRHLHNIIDGSRLDCLHVTERTGRPYALVLSKTIASHQARFKIYQRDVKNLERLRKLISKMS